MTKVFMGVCAVLLVSLLASGCNQAKEGADTASANPSPSDSIDLVLQSRYPQTDSVLRSFGMRILSRRIHNTFTVRFMVDLGEDSPLRQNSVFDSLALAITSADINDSMNAPIEFWDSLRGVRAHFRKIQGLLPAVYREDSSGFFLPPPQFAPANGASRAKLAYWRVLEKFQKGRKDMDVRCGGAIDANGNLFYNLEMFSASDGPMSAHRAYHVAIDARTGVEWIPPDGPQALYDPSTPLVSKDGTKFLHLGPDTFSTNWRTVQANCPEDEENVRIWQYRAATHRLQRLDLDVPSLDLEIDLDTTGFQGRLIQMYAEVEPDSTGWGYLLAISRESDGYWIYRTGGGHLFGERSQIPDSYQFSKGFRFIQIPSEGNQSAELRVSSLHGGFTPSELEWSRSPKFPQSPTEMDSVRTSEDSVAN